MHKILFFLPSTVFLCLGLYAEEPKQVATFWKQPLPKISERLDLQHVFRISIAPGDDSAVEARSLCIIFAFPDYASAATEIKTRGLTDKDALNYPAQKSRLYYYYSQRGELVSCGSRPLELWGFMELHQDILVSEILSVGDAPAEWAGDKYVGPVSNGGKIVAEVFSANGGYKKVIRVAGASAPADYLAGKLRQLIEEQWKPSQGK